MSPTLIYGVVGLVVVSAAFVWLLFKSNRTPVDDHVSASVLTRINTEYRDSH